MKNPDRMKSLLILVACILTSPFLLAHNTLQSSVPADQEVLRQSPEFVELRFSDETYLNAVTLTDANGKEVPLDFELPGGLSGHFSIPLPGLAPGKYTVSWQVEGMDTHVISGDFTFTLSDGR